MKKTIEENEGTDHINMFCNKLFTLKNKCKETEQKIRQENNNKKRT